MAVKIKNVHTFKYNLKEHGEKISGDSMTVKGQAYTIREIMERSAGGLVPTSVEGYYEDEADFDSVDMEKLSTADLVDKDEIVEDAFDKEVTNFRERMAGKSKDDDPEEEAVKKLADEDEEEDAVKSPAITDKKSQQ